LRSSKYLQRFLLKVKRKIGAFLIAMKKRSGTNEKTDLWPFTNRSGIPRLLAAIKTASIIFGDGKQTTLHHHKKTVWVPIITQMRENGKKRRARMWAFAKARMQQIKERTAKVAAVIAVISGQITQRARGVCGATQRCYGVYETTRHCHEKQSHTFEEQHAG
jgi:hypothetical protein